MTVASHAGEVHRMVDRLAPAQVEVLYVILRGMLGGVDDKCVNHVTEAAGRPADRTSAGAAPEHRFAFIGIMDGEPDLAERSARILREELGNPTT